MTIEIKNFKKNTKRQIKTCKEKKVKKRRERKTKVLTNKHRPMTSTTQILKHTLAKLLVMNKARPAIISKVQIGF